MQRPARLARSAVQFAAAAGLALWSASAGAAEYTVDPNHSSVGFSVRHLISTVHGEFREFSGSLSFDPVNPGAAKGRFTAKTATVDTNNPKRDAHLRTGDFFAADKFPELTLVIKSLTPAGDHAYKLLAALTIRGVTKDVTFDATYLGTSKTPWKTTAAGFAATATINRKDFGLLWNAAIEGGGLLVGDDVKLDLQIEATPQG